MCFVAYPFFFYLSLCFFFLRLVSLHGPPLPHADDTEDLVSAIEGQRHSPFDSDSGVGPSSMSDVGVEVIAGGAKSGKSEKGQEKMHIQVLSEFCFPRSCVLRRESTRNIQVLFMDVVFF